VLDLHAGGLTRYARTTSFHRVADPEQGRTIEATARWFGTPVVLVYQDETPGLLTSEAERLGKITIGGEFGWGAAISVEGVRYARHGVRAAAIHHQQLSGDIQPIGHHADGTQVKVEMVDRACFSIAPFAGHYEPLHECGEAVRAGEVVGLLHDFERLDLDPWPVRAGVDGIVAAQAWGARVVQGQHVLVVARQVAWQE
jgi:N-alpha-acetyl-L-2,4-diaminobutyrate deacetylase